MVYSKNERVKSFKKYFKQSIRANYPKASESLILSIEKEYNSISGDVNFASGSSNPMDRRLNLAAYFLALIKILGNHGENYNTIRLISLEIITEYVRPKNKFQRALKKLPVKLMGHKITNLFLKLFDKKLRAKGHPDGFLARIITDKNETYGLGYGVDILECGVCKLFKKHQLESYASILCEVDKITSGLAGLNLIRTGTIANGAKKCDFRFKPVKQ
ncbi:MAG: hypothetical protein C0490_16085 [Marivirga sp.]|nr:hypothetical protein [Marivirga sp.]